MNDLLLSAWLLFGEVEMSSAALRNASLEQNIIKQDVALRIDELGEDFSVKNVESIFGVKLDFQERDGSYTKYTGANECYENVTLILMDTDEWHYSILVLNMSDNSAFEHKSFSDLKRTLVERNWEEPEFFVDATERGFRSKRGALGLLATIEGGSGWHGPPSKENMVGDFRTDGAFPSSIVVSNSPAYWAY